MSEATLPSNVMTRLERELGLPAQWTVRLLAEDPWSLVIKFHAVFEAAMTHLLEAELDRPQLRDFVGGMNMGGQFGKLALAQNLGVIDPEHVRFIRALGKIRNDCIHDVKNISFDFATYLANLKANQREDLVTLVRSQMFKQATELQEHMLDGLVQNDMKTAIFVAGLSVLAVIYDKKTLAATLAKANKRILAEAEAKGPKFLLADMFADGEPFGDLSFSEKGFPL